MKRFLSSQSLGVRDGVVIGPLNPGERQIEAYRALMGKDPPESDSPQWKFRPRGTSPKERIAHLLKFNG